MLIEGPVLDNGLERSFNELGHSVGAGEED